MKTLRKMDLDELKRVNTVLNLEQQKMFVGGGIIYLTGGGTAISYGSYTFVTAPNGQVYFFDGVTVSSGSPAWNGAACQYNGVIYQGDGLSLNGFIHEYGHYLQQASGVNYAWVIAESAGKSMLEMLGIDSNYYGTGYEHDASVRGNAYMDQENPGSPYTAPIH